MVAEPLHTSKTLLLMHDMLGDSHGSSAHSVVHSNGTSVSTVTSAASMTLQLLTRPPNAICIAPSAIRHSKGDPCDLKVGESLSVQGTHVRGMFSKRRRLSARIWPAITAEDCGRIFRQ